MTDNKTLLDQARKHVREFTEEMEARRLNEASAALENVVLAQEHDAGIRHQLRADCLGVWLEMIQLLDRVVDPAFDPGDPPDELVEPPPLRNGVVLRPGADPASIDDPQLRADYEKAIADNRARIKSYRLQTYLRRLNDRIPRKAADFIRNFYTTSPADTAEVAAAIEQAIEKPGRKAELSKSIRF